MKNTVIIFILVFYGLVAFGQSQEKTEIRKLEPFDKIKISKGINVTLREGENPEAEIFIINANLDDVLIIQNENELFIRMKTKTYKDVSVNVYVTYQNLKEIQAGLGGSLESEDIIETEELTLVAGMNASIEIEIEVVTLKAAATSSSSLIKVAGIAKNIDINILSGGKYIGNELQCEVAKVRADTSASVQLCVTEHLNAYAANGATIKYIGGPSHVDSNTLKGGKILEIDNEEEEDED